MHPQFFFVSSGEKPQIDFHLGEPRKLEPKRSCNGQAIRGEHVLWPWQGLPLPRAERPPEPMHAATVLYDW